MKKLDKKGILGLDTVKAIILFLLVLAIITIVMFLVLSPLLTSVETIDVQSASAINESVTIVDTGSALSANTLRNPVCTITQVQNATNPLNISVGNYTQTGCTLSNSSQVCAAGSCVQPWRISYSYTYDNPNPNYLVNNMTNAPRNFFSNVPTFFTLLGVVVLVLIIAIVIIAVTRYQGASPEGTLQEL